MALDELLGALRRRWWLVVAVIAVFTATGFTVATTTTPTYTAAAQLIAVVVGTEKSRLPTGMTEVLAAEEFSRSRITEYTSFADTEAFLQRVVDNNHLPISRSDLASSLTMSSPKDTAIIRVTARSHSPVMAADIANASVQELAKVLHEREPSIPLRTEVVEAARVPTTPLVPVLWLTVAQSAVLGLTAGVFGAVAMSLARDRRRSLGW
jgi:polysaccharide biosynthesis transport protein